MGRMAGRRRKESLLSVINPRPDGSHKQVSFSRQADHMGANRPQRLACVPVTRGIERRGRCLSAAPLHVG